jgi:hypothetical protein
MDVRRAGASRKIGDERESVKETALVGVVLDPEEIQPGLVRFPSLFD